MKKSFAIIGLGRFGLGIVKTLSNLNCELIAIDIDNASANKAAQYVDHVIISDSTNINNLKEIGISNVDHVVVAIGNNLQATILTTINLKELGVKRITVRVDSDQHSIVMQRLGADEVIIPEEASAISLANQIISDSFLDYYKLNGDYGVVKVKVKPQHQGKALMELDLRNRYDVNIVGISRKGKFFLPKGTDTLLKDDLVYVIGKTQSILKIFE